MCRWLVLCLFPTTLLLAEPKRIEFQTGPFTVVSEAGEKPGREILTRLEQFRFTFGSVLGNPNLEPLWPVRVLVTASAVPNASSASLTLARDNFVAAIPATGPMPRAIYQSLGRLLLDQHQTRLAKANEEALVALYSTLEVNATKVTLGAPVPPAERTRDWARLHLLSVSPAYSGKLRVYFSNLGSGADLATASRNAFERTAEQIDQEAAAYLQAGQFGTTLITSKPISPERDFRPHTAEPADVALLRADLAGTASAYQALGGALADEGVGLLAAQQQQPDLARTHLQKAAAANSTDARVFYELAMLTVNPAEQVKLWEKSMTLRPRWAAPYVALANASKTPDRQIAALRKAAELAPREQQRWIALARVLQANNQMTEAAKAWSAAERLALDAASQAEIRATREGFENERAAQAIAARQQAIAAREAEMEKLKNDALTRIREAEAKANAQLSGTTKGAVVPWWTQEQKGQLVSGTLTRLDCLGKGTSRARAVIRKDDGGELRLLVPQLAGLPVTGVQTPPALACGPTPQTSVVTIRFQPQTNAALGTAGTVLAIEFR